MICWIIFFRSFVLGNEIGTKKIKRLKELKQFVLDNLNRDMDDTTFIVALAAFATCTGRTKLGKAIMELEDKNVMDEFLEQF
jgi:hypothetical protein